MRCLKMNNVLKNSGKLTTAAQSFLLVGLLAFILGLMGWLLGGTQFALMAVGFVVLLYLINPMVPPQVILRLQKVRRLDYHEAPHLYDMMQKLSERARLPQLPILYYSPSDMMNAFTIGNRKYSAVAVTEGLLRHLDRNEIGAVLAHEISHLRHNDLRIMGFAALSHQLVQMLALMGQFLLLLNLPLYLLGHYTISWTAILLLIFAPSLSAMLQLALSRTREYRADIGAAELMGDGRALASALMKMEFFQKRYLRGLFWPAYKPIPAGTLLRTHPPTKDRVRRLLGADDHRLTINNKTSVPLNEIPPRVFWHSPRRFRWDN